MNLEALEQKAPIVRKLADAQEVSWINPYYGKTEEALREIDLSMADVEEAAARLLLEGRSYRQAPSEDGFPSGGGRVRQGARRDL